MIAKEETWKRDSAHPIKYQQISQPMDAKVIEDLNFDKSLLKNHGLISPSQLVYFLCDYEAVWVKVFQKQAFIEFLSKLWINT